MDNLKKISRTLLENDNFIIIPHRNPDGDCVGSSVALLAALRSVGKTAYISLPNEIPQRLCFLWDKSYETPDNFKCDVCVCVDVASDYMMSHLKEEIFDKSNLTVCIDHHGTNSGYAKINYVDAKSAAAGEIIYQLILEMGIEITKPVAEALYTAIVSDTGSFRYSNTTASSHKITAHLLDVGIDSSKIMKILFETKTISQMQVMSDIISNMEFFCGGKVCITYCDSNLLEKYGITFDEVDEYVSLPRTVEGVEVGIFLKCHSDTETKVSLRSNEYIDVAAISNSLGGGGHIRASGVTINDNRHNAKEILLSKLKELF